MEEEGLDVSRDPQNWVLPQTLHRQRVLIFETLLDFVKKVDMELRPACNVFVKTVDFIVYGLAIHIGALELAWVQAN